MSKELTLNQIISKLKHDKKYDEKIILKIETALKRLEVYDKEHEETVKAVCEMEKVLQIIKEKINFSIVRIQEVNDVYELEKPTPKWSYHYYINTPYHSWEITKEQFDLLKEVLL